MRRKTVQELESTKEMTGLVQQACLVAKDAAFNLRDFLENSSNMAFIAVKDCEKELDRAERKIDEAVDRTAEAQRTLQALRDVLSSSLSESKAVDWEALKDETPFPKPVPKAPNRPLRPE